MEQQIGELDVAIDRLRSLYDQYFMGIERIEPAVPRKDVERKIYALRKEQIRNTALRFRFQMILQRYSTFQAHWQRICREIENGTYKRLLRHSERRRGPQPEALQALVATQELDAAPAPDAPLPREEFPEPGARAHRAPLPEPGAPLPRDLAAELEELDRDFAPATPRGIGPPATRVVPTAGPGSAPARTPVPPKVAAVAPARTPHLPPARPPALPSAPGKPGAPTLGKPATQAAGKSPQVPPAPPSTPGKVAPAATAPPPRADGGLPEYRVRQLYVEYVDAKRRQKESTAAITYEALAASLRASSTKLREKHGKPVDFEVGIKDGKAVLRPKLK